MEKKTHGVVRLDKVRSVKVGHIYDVVDAVNELHNGMLIKLGAKIKGERELYKAETGGNGDRFLVVTTPEVKYEEDRKYGLLDFLNPADRPARAHDVEPQDIFSVSSELITAIDTNKGVQVENFLVNDGRKYKEVKEIKPTDDYGFIAEILDMETIGGLLPYSGSGSANSAYQLVAMHVIKNGNYRN